MMRRILLLAGLAGLAFATPSHAAELKIGLQDDVDVMDPDMSRSFTARIVYAGLCDKLVDFAPSLKVLPQLATSWTWSTDGKVLTMELRHGVKFQDDTPFNAAAVVTNIDRSQHLKESKRKAELASVDHVEAVGDYQVKFYLKAPDVTLLAQLGDRAGMMKSAKALKEEGADFGKNPVCSGPFKFVSRTPQDRVVLEKFKDYWNAKNVFLDKVTYLPIPDSTVRLANLRSGDIDMMERVAPTDLASVKQDAKLGTATAISLGFEGIMINIAQGTKKPDTPFSKSKLVRQALSLAIDRKALNQVVFEGAYTPGNQPFPSNSPWYNKAMPVPDRDVDKAKALLKQAGYDHVDITMMVPNDPISLQTGQVLQSMVADAGINLKLEATEFNTLLSREDSGDYQLTIDYWSGRADPDGNTYAYYTCKGDYNDMGYCDQAYDSLVSAARASTDVALRKKDYAQAVSILTDDTPYAFLYHPTWIWALHRNLKGFVPAPDGMIRLIGMKKG